MNNLSKNKKILLTIVSSPIFVIFFCYTLMMICLSPFIVIIGGLVSLIEHIKGDEDAWVVYFHILRDWCLFGLVVYFDTVWDYELFDD